MPRRRGDLLPNDGGIAAAIKPNTRLIHVPSSSNPVLRCVDLAAVGKLGRERGVLTAIDNAFAAPINQNPIPHGFDAVIHRETKMLERPQRRERGRGGASYAVIRRLTAPARNFGGKLDAHAC